MAEDKQAKLERLTERHEALVEQIRYEEAEVGIKYFHIQGMKRRLDLLSVEFYELTSEGKKESVE